LVDGLSQDADVVARLSTKRPRCGEKRGVFVVPIVFTALRIPSGEGEFAGFLAQALLVGGIVFLLLLLAGVVF
jgi:hypothetical protein